MMAQTASVTRAELVEAMRAGERAALDGESPLACPWSAAGDADDRLRVAAWMRAYTRTRNAGD
jgi:hypothetical protein